jgi:hypothetical protein
MRREGKRVGRRGNKKASRGFGGAEGLTGLLGQHGARFEFLNCRAQVLPMLLV